MADREPIIPRLEEQFPDENLASAAVREIKDPEGMFQFIGEYVSKMVRDDDFAEEYASDIAHENIGYFLGSYDEETARAWFAALPDLKHPYFDREVVIDLDEVRERGRLNGIKAERMRKLAARGFRIIEGGKSDS